MDLDIYEIAAGQFRLFQRIRAFSPGPLWNWDFDEDTVEKSLLQRALGYEVTKTRTH